MVAHNTLTGSELHESKGADTAAINTVPVANGSGSAPFQALTYAQMPVGALIQYASASISTSDSSSTSIPFDTSVPQNTEGKQCLSLSFTPKSATSLLRIKVLGHLGSTDPSEQGVFTIFKDSETSARATGAVNVNSSYIQQASIEYTMTAGSTSSMTFYLRYGSNREGGGVAYLNQTNSSSNFGGTVSTILSIEEIKV